MYYKLLLSGNRRVSKGILMNKKVYCADLTHTGNGTMALTFPLGASYVVSYAKKS